MILPRGRDADSASTHPACPRCRRRFTWVDLSTRSWFPTALLLAVAVTPRALAALRVEEATLSRGLLSRWDTAGRTAGAVGRASVLILAFWGILSLRPARLVSCVLRLCICRQILNAEVLGPIDKPLYSPRI
jgi:hypothetical protein